MSNTPFNVNSPEVANAFRDRFKKLVKEDHLTNEISNVILEVLGEFGIEIPDKVKQAIKDYQPNR